MASNSHTLYDILPIPPTSGATGPSFRLLKPGVDNSWYLEVESLSTARQTYKALSYRWGDRDDTVPILCNGHILQVPRNLHSALAHLGAAFPDDAFWIDYICINQEDNDEKGLQVGIMREIYSDAGEVLIWLEPALLPKNTGECFSACRLFASQFRVWEDLATAMLDLWGARNSEPVDDSATRFALRKALENGNPFSDSIMDGLLRILGQPYWLRVWVIQEMCLAKNARIFAAQHSLEWDDFKTFLVMVGVCMPWALRDMHANFRDLIELSQTCQHPSKTTTAPSLPELLIQFRWSGASDPRDKIYGLLGLIPALDRELSGADSDDMYTISVAECYSRVTFALLQQSRNLSLLVHCLAPRFVTRRDDLPSWVPDWSYDSSHFPPARFGLVARNPYHRLGCARPEIYNAYRASGGSPCPVPTRRGGILTLHGMTAGRVVTVCRALEISHQYPQLKNHKGILEPFSPVSWDEYTGQIFPRQIWKIIRHLSLPSLLLFPVSAYRKGGALDIFLEWARLARSEDKGDDRLPAMFITLMKGQKGCELFHSSFTDKDTPVSIAEVVNEFRELQNALWWNPLLQLLVLTRASELFPGLYQLVLGLSYDHHRGAIRLSGVLFSLLMVFVANLLNHESISQWVPPYTIFFLTWIGDMLAGTWSIPLAKQKHLDAVLATPLDYAMAKLDDGKLALVPHSTLHGDEIALLSGSPCPFVVKRAGSSQWKLVGDCYVDGMMEGKLWREEKAGKLDFV